MYVESTLLGFSTTQDACLNAAVTLQSDSMSMKLHEEYTHLKSQEEFYRFLVIKYVYVRAIEMTKQAKQEKISKEQSQQEKQTC